MNIGARKYRIAYVVFAHGTYIVLLEQRRSRIHTIYWQRLAWDLET